MAIELSCWEHIPMYEVDEKWMKDRKWMNDGIELLGAHTYV